MSTPSDPAAPETKPRFHSVDALRGVAALAVVLFHLLRNSPQADTLAATFPAPYVTASDYARGGVAVFFVLSGLVITYTVRDLGRRPRDALRYSARRQLRLDPPYWAMMAVVLAIAAAERLVPGLDYRSIGAADVAANAVYVQGFAAATPVLAVAWTLCLEVQFYLVIVLLVLLAGRLPHGDDVTARRRTVRWTAWTLGAASLVLLATGTSTGPWFLGTWWMFCLGATVAWYLVGDVGPATLGVALGVVALAVAVETATGAADPWRTEWFAWTTAALLAVLVATGRLGVRPWGWLIFLGTISYSLYLVHLPSSTP
ncbi:peptidoglycan/LPS O-acetylase OafA/YrhL [Isoptericola jiangsuensis]|uniref:Peptidoglycan/LPS O-acetylase OafA/YrhL n=1 Tax=Isoptericola jiangsuensis TaxID=548579 RepID=A0A2A9F099_9MICO|nr:acyltransferase [Isoptericola jiangsuensis]PFG44201.1 peptidoglycan/LPS O-acetylase OafA/YrhL [Isoptericola jiangsuensis]